MIDDYTIEEPLGRGGMGAVFRATHQRSGVPVAIKVVHSHLVHEGKERRAFNREVAAMASMNHRSIVRIFDLGETPEEFEEFHAGTPWFAMEIANGGSFSPTWITDFPDLLRILFDILDALSYAHARGIIHRDIKPDNILLAGDDATGWRPVLTDFGLAHSLNEEEEITESELNGAAGTPAYMAPEQFHGAWRTYGPWTDLYSLGCMAWQLACDGPPFQAPSMLQLALKHTREPLPPMAPRFPVPRHFEAWLRRCTEKDHVRRFQSAADAYWTLYSILRADDDDWQPAPALRQRGGTETNPTFPTLTVNLDTVLLSSREMAKVVALDARPQDSVDVIRPPIPSHVVEAPTPQPMPLEGVGLNLFGLRQIPFVNRNRERMFIWNSLKDACGGEMKTVVLSGEPGVGKSRLARWVTRRAEEVGAARVVTVRHAALNSPLHGIVRALKTAMGALELEGADLMHHIEDVLEGWFELAGEDISLDDLNARANEIAQLLVPVVPEGMPRVTFESPEQRFILIAWVLGVMARVRPLVLVLDDAEYGAESLSLARYLLRLRPKVPLLLMICVGDLDSRPAESELLDELLDRFDLGRIVVEELNPADREAFVRALIPLDDRSVFRVVRATGGRPAKAIQTIADLIARDSLIPSPQGFTISDEDRFTSEIQNVWARTVGRLSTEAGQEAIVASEIAAAMGNQVLNSEWEAACAAFGITAPATLLDVTGRMGLTEEYDDGWGFRQTEFAVFLREHAREKGRWARIHKACASIELADPQNGASRYERYAYHLNEAGEYRASADALIEATNDLMARSSYLQALVIARKAEERLTRLGVPAEAPERVNLFTHQLEAARFQGRFQDARDEMASGEARVMACPDASARANAFRAFGNLAYFSSEHEASMRWFQRAFDEVPDDDHLLRAKLHHGFGWILSNTPSLEDAVTHFRAGAASAADARDDNERAWCLHGLADVMYRLGNPNGEALARESCRLFEETGSRTGYATARSVCGDYARRKGLMDEAREHYEIGAGTLQKVGSIVESMVRSRLAMLYLVEGRDDEALHEARTGRARIERAMIPLRVVLELQLALLEPDGRTRAARRRDAENLLNTARYVHPDVDELLDRLADASQD